MRWSAGAALSIALLVGGTRARADQFVLSIDTPANGSAIGDPLGLALVSGRVVASEQTGIDVMFAIDLSRSTAARAARPRGWRRWLGWLLPHRRAPAPAGVLDQEIERALELLAQLDPRSARAGVVAFAGDWDPGTPDAWVAAPLGDLETARGSLHALLARGSGGATNLIDGLELARSELLGEIGSASRARAGARRALLLLTDGVDVHPLHPDPEEARALLKGAVARATVAGIDVDVIALSTGAAHPALAGVADAGGGILAPGELPDLLRGSDLAQIHVRNARSGAEATAAWLAGERFAALVALAPGSNALEVRARTRSGFETRGELEVVWDPSVRVPPAAPELLRVHNDLLAAHLHALRGRRVETRLEIHAEPAPH